MPELLRMSFTNTPMLYIRVEIVGGQTNKQQAIPIILTCDADPVADTDFFVSVRTHFLPAQGYYRVIKVLG